MNGRTIATAQTPAGRPAARAIGRPAARACISPRMVKLCRFATSSGGCPVPIGSNLGLLIPDSSEATCPIPKLTNLCGAIHGKKAYRYREEQEKERGEDDSLGVSNRRRYGPAYRKWLSRAARLKRLEALKAKTATPTSSSTATPKAKSFWTRRLLARMTPAQRAEYIRRAIRRNPRLKKMFAIALLKRRLAARKAGAYASPSATQQTEVPSVAPSPPPATAPTRAPIPEEEAEPTAQAVEEEQMEQPLEKAATEEEAEKEGAEAAEQETDEQVADEAATQSSEETAEEMTEPSSEEAAESAEDAAKSAAEASGICGDNILLGVTLAQRRHHLRRRNREAMAIQRAALLAKKIEAASGGALKAETTLKGVGLIAKAKGGNIKAKQGIKAIAKKAGKGNPKAKKALAHLKVSHKVLKKTKPTATKGKRTVPYTKPVAVTNKGLFANNAYQRGMAMIPGVARAHYGNW